jgi:hypothetical protein
MVHGGYCYATHAGKNHPAEFCFIRRCEEQGDEAILNRLIQNNEAARFARNDKNTNKSSWRA